jgi:N-acetylmuramoyl-L-alanine amidase
VIWHGAEGHNIRAYFGTYEARKVRQVSAHYAIERDGRTDTIVPEDMAAWHCGGSTIPGWDGNPNRCTIGIEMACDPAPAAPGWTEAQIQAAIKLGRDISARRGISRIHHHRHSGVDASKRDPREFPWGRLMDAMFPPPPEPEPPEEDEDVDMEKIRNAAWNALDVPLNPDAAFQRYAREHDLGAPLTAELYIWLDPVNYCYQGYMGGIVWASVGDWGNVKHLAW